jgi:hypothetical protein
MHLDGYNKELKICFEFNGPQHYHIYSKYHKSYEDFTNQVELDSIKAELCEKKEKTLITVPYWVDYDGYQDYIIKEYKKITGKSLENIPNYDWRIFKKPKSNLDKFF